MTLLLQRTSQIRLHQIALARQAVLQDGKSMSRTGTQAWIERSWQRCLASGKRPEQKVSFDVVAPNAMRHLIDSHQTLLTIARPTLQCLARAIANTRYFVILTNAQGVVIDAQGAIDRSDRRADLITRTGTDLSEHALATTAISAALSELQPIWLHQGEHFYDANAVYSCAGAPLFGHDGVCIGMLDLTGIETAERPELKHLVAQSARSIENALTIGRLKTNGDLLIRLNWPGRTLGDETDGLVCLSADGYVTAANQMARIMVPQLIEWTAEQHVNEVFAMQHSMLFDAARSRSREKVLEIPLWTGLRLNAMPLMGSKSGDAFCSQVSSPLSLPLPLKDIETALIRNAVDEARGNVQEAAKRLGISRATIYRRLGAALKRV